MDEGRPIVSGEENMNASQTIDGSPAPAPSTAAPLPRRAFSPLMVSGSGDPSSSSPRRMTPTNRNSSHRIRYEDLLNRPRSNPRVRTPMRYESPIDSNAFRRDAVLSETAAEEEENQQRRSTTPIEAGGTRRITVRPMAGAAVGTMPAAPRRRVNEQQQRQQRDGTSSALPLKSHKQGPSQRKVRRWKHENFVDLASEFAKNDKDGRGKATAEAILKGRAEAHLYRDVYNPEDSRSKAISSFMGDENLREIRDKFFECELPAGKRSNNSHIKKRFDDNIGTPKKLIQRIDKRLQRVVEKACKNSFPACKVVESFESFLVLSFTENVDDPNLKEQKTDPSNHQCKEDNSFSAIIEEVLLKPPIVTRTQSKNESSTMITTIQMFFDGESPNGGFHRLLVHAAAQFHGLKSTSNLVDGIQVKGKNGNSDVNDGNNSYRGHRNRARVLTVTGKSVMGKEYKLLDHILDRKTNEDQTYQNSTVNDVGGTGIGRDSNNNRDILKVTEKDNKDRDTEGWELIESVKIIAL